MLIGDAVKRLKDGSLPACATVINFDDGFYSIWRSAVPVLAKFKLPGTIYVTTYYCVKENPIFRLVVQYMLWKTTRAELDLDGLGLDREVSEDQRVRLCEEFGRNLGVDYEKIVIERLLTLMTQDEVREAGQVQKVDIQLHTHRHVLPEDAELAGKEIRDNRAVLEPLVGRRLHHFCYPSGVHHPVHLRPLEEADVTSATTCGSGINYADTPPLRLHRFLDGNNVSAIEFESEMSGFAELLRKTRSLLSNPGQREERAS